MRRCHIPVLIGLSILCAADAASTESDVPREFAVENTFNNSPFRYQMKRTSIKRGYQIYRMTYPSPVETSVKQNNRVPADYYLPDGIRPEDPKRPAVICIHILDGNFELVRILCSALASHGIPAMMFKLPYYGERALSGGQKELARNGQLFVESLPQAIEDARRTFDVLASRPEVDPKRIGISGISLGGIISASAAGADPRFDRTVLILAGGNLLRVIHHCREASDLSQYIKSLPRQRRTEIEQAIEAVDPLTRAPGLRERAKAGKVLMINASEDNVVPHDATIQLANALGITDQVVWLDGLGHYTAISSLPAILRRTVDFFAVGLPSGVKASEATGTASRNPLKMVAELLAQAASIMTVEPKDGRCHAVDLIATITDKKGTTHEGSLRFTRGVGDRFFLHLEIPKLGKVSLGQADYPWMVTTKTVFRGGKGDENGAIDPLADADPRYLAKVRTVLGGLATLTLAPTILEQVVVIQDETAGDGPPRIRVAAKKSQHDYVRIEFLTRKKSAIQKDSQTDAHGARKLQKETFKESMTPRSATFDIDGFHGTVTFRRWQLNREADAALFEPPADLPAEEVSSADLSRTFSAMFNFAMELLE